MMRRVESLGQTPPGVVRFAAPSRSQQQASMEVPSLIPLTPVLRPSPDPMGSDNSSFLLDLLEASGTAGTPNSTDGEVRGIFEHQLTNLLLERSKSASTEQRNAALLTRSKSSNS